MSIQSFKFSWLFAFAICALVFTSCSKEETTASDEADAFVDEALFRIQDSGNMGRFGCYELVFPITINYADSSSATLNSYEELKAAIRAYKEANPDATEKPELSYPLEVLTEEGEIIVVNNQEELRELRSACPRNFFGKNGHRGHRKRGCSCFDLVFPLSIQFPDGTSAEAADRDELKTLARTWKEANPDATERPELVFPVDVLLDDGTTVTVDSKEALRELKEGCSSE